ncbi:MAG: ubiquinol-cytochrome C chaperone family protein [Parvibaculum sp.]|uniref:ubiquinol-cytochrome C chaperone family protein n=1 Tax=Parvibaculum sp. TaxID=2024848 RepID=UPI002725F0E3|nr:ubiquinol-cytochrome C chaperone family protein [Parvibaculum sp.]MDO8840196.1 ubiquinol-cytochrome C chaperone family protein [Parvibaculum sp.]
MGHGRSETMIWKRIFGRRRGEEEAFSLYRAVVAQARLPAFYLQGGVPDTVEGRFEMVSLHAFLVLRRLRAAGAEGRALGQRVFNVLFDDMDQTLREMGVGDLSVGKKIKALAASFYGRIGAYEDGLRANDHAVLADALARNVFGQAVAEGHAAMLADYVRQCDQALASQSADDIMAGHVEFVAPPESTDRADRLVAGN